MVFILTWPSPWGDILIRTVCPKAPAFSYALNSDCFNLLSCKGEKMKAGQNSTESTVPTESPDCSFKQIFHGKKYNLEVCFK